MVERNDSRLRRRRVLQAFGGTGAVTLAGCLGNGDTDDEETPTPGDDDDTADPTPTPTPDDVDDIPRGGDLIVGVLTDVDNYDSINITGAASRSKTGLIYERLTAIDFNVQAQPFLAESIDWVDDETARVHCREGVEFHNGDPFNAYSVQASIERSIGTARDGFVSPWYEDSEIVDEHTIDLILQSPFAPLEAEMLPEIQMVPEGAQDGEVDLTEEPIGTGPFVFDEHREGEFFRVSRNEDYWFEGSETMPATTPLDSVTFRVIPEPTTQQSAVETGEVHVAETVPDASVAELREMDGINVIDMVGGTFSGIVFPTRIEPWSNEKIRRGVVRMIPRDAIVDIVYDGLAAPGHIHVPPMMEDPWVPQEFVDRLADEYVGTDPERAQELLQEGFEEEGIEPPYESQVVTYDPPATVRTAEMIHDTLNGTEFFDLELEEFEISTYFDRWLSDEQLERDEISMIGITGSPSPYEYFNRIVTESGFPPACCNMSGWSDDRLEELLVQAEQTTDEDALIDIYQEMVEIAAEASPWGINVWTMEINVTREEVMGWDVFYDPAWAFTAIFSPYADSVVWLEE